MQEINLLQKESQSSDRFSLNIRQNGHFWFYIAVALVILAILFYGFLFFSNRRVTKDTSEVQQRGIALELEISKINEQRERAIAVQSRVENLEVLLDSHLFWSKVFAELENKSYKPVRLESLQVDQINNRFILTGLAKNQTDLAKFMLGLKTSPDIQNVVLKTSSAQQTEESGYAFSMDVIFDPKLLRNGQN